MNVREKIQKFQEWSKVDANYYTVLLVAFMLLALVMDLNYVEQKKSFGALCSNYCRDTVNGTMLPSNGQDCRCVHYVSIDNNNPLGLGNFHPVFINATPS